MQGAWKTDLMAEVNSKFRVTCLVLVAQKPASGQHTKTLQLVDKVQNPSGEPREQQLSSKESPSTETPTGTQESKAGIPGRAHSQHS